MAVINYQQSPQDEVRAIYDNALAAFGDRSFSEVFLIVRYLVHGEDFDRMKPIIEKQIGRKLNLKKPIGTREFATAWKTLSRFMPRKPPAGAVDFRKLN
jgi:hypothetical protein